MYNVLTITLAEAIESNWARIRITQIGSNRAEAQIAGPTIRTDYWAFEIELIKLV